MNLSPLISIGIPTYNRPEGLKKVLECMISQSYDNLEIIVSDNCSTDHSVGNVLQSFDQKDERVKIFRQEKNVGLALNFQFVLSKATGKYFMWLADDDLVENNFISTLFPVLEESASTNLVLPAFNLFNAKGERVDASGKYKALEGEEPEKRVYDYFRQELKMSYFYGLYRTDIIRQFEFTKKMFGADILLSVCMAFSGKVKICHDTSYTYYMGGNSIDVERLARVIGLPQWKTPFWGFNDALVVGKSVLSFPVFKRIPAGRRVLFCLRVMVLMLKKTRAFLYFFLILKRKTLMFFLNRPTLKRP